MDAARKSSIIVYRFTPVYFVQLSSDLCTRVGLLSNLETLFLQNYECEI